MVKHEVRHLSSTLQGKIKVVGTAFNVWARGQQTRVTVRKGACG
jgi:ferric-dicitrate binding protein FerR (iron transport regulator)